MTVTVGFNPRRRLAHSAASRSDARTCGREAGTPPYSVVATRRDGFLRHAIVRGLKPAVTIIPSLRDIIPGQAGWGRPVTCVQQQVFRERAFSVDCTTTSSSCQQYLVFLIAPQPQLLAGQRFRCLEIGLHFCAPAFALRRPTAAVNH